MRLRCACHHAFTPEGHLVEGVMRVRCHRCKGVIVLARWGTTTVQVTVTTDEAATMQTVLDVLRWSEQIARAS